MASSKSSLDSIEDATRERGRFSGHGGALGAAGRREASTDPANSEYLREPGQCIAISPGEGGLKSVTIGAAWDKAEVKNTAPLTKLLKKTVLVDVDIDIGCLYELADGTRGAIQAFGNKFGARDKPPYIKLSGDERTGVAKGFDEKLHVDGQHWDKIKKIIVYLYIYNGPPSWASINPRVMVDVPGEDDLYVTLGAHNDSLKLCAIGGLESVRGGIKLTNYTEYFPGHEEMDRAFGFGLEWGEGRK